MTLDDLRRDPAFARYHFWPGVAGLVYASRLACSPPVVKRSPTVENLREQVVLDMEYRDTHWG